MTAVDREECQWEAFLPRVKSFVTASSTF